MVVVDSTNGKLVAGPEIHARGAGIDDAGLSEVRPLIEAALASAAQDGINEVNQLRQLVRRTTGRWVSQDPLGIGINIGYAFAPWNSNVIVDPFLSLDYLNMPVNQNFAGGSFLGARSNYELMTGVKIGPAMSRQIWLYGIAGVGALDETLTINFVPLTSSTTRTVACPNPLRQ